MATGQPSAEESERMMKFLTDMEELQRTDPEGFSKLLDSMGLGAAEGDKQEASMGRSAVIDAIAQLRASKNSGVNADIELPDGNTLSSTGVKSKQKGIQITPEPGFTVKTKNQSGSKIFINVCQHAEIAVPAIKKRLNAEGEEVEGMNIPLSAGPARLGKDKSGVDCSIYDVIVNPQVIKDVLADPTGQHRDFICQLTIQSIEQKYSVVLDKRYKLPKIRYMGEVVPQMIQDRKNMPNIEEVSGTSSNKKKDGKGRSTAKQSKVETKRVQEPDKELEVTQYWRYDSGEEVKVVVEESQSGLGVRVYREPLAVPDDGVTHLVVKAVLDVKDSLSTDSISIALSAYKLQVKVPGYTSLSLSLPCAVICTDLDESQNTDSTPVSQMCRMEGYTRLLCLCITLPVDRTPWSAAPDPGSKPWMIAEALRGSDVGNRGGGAGSSVETQRNDSEYPEDKFHIQLPDNVDKYTGVKYDEEEFPEDRFHKNDAVSQYIIDQREKDVKAKWEKHEKEKAERANDPDVEYIDVDDFKPGGKYGPEGSSASADLVEVKEELQRAAGVVASSLETEENRSSATDQKGGVLGLTSQLW
eukprot:CAMPEP_0185038478 /NCGR_PEP_ID=MMETSP1103-20130426/34192_1 /TAXON_ID=36769 /ORGANISM="Paraphysomonas bandaiensis, Strain Caron Lab Isolate" /LENGTH=583 /DNA_ID=CAMNT_0027576927 /DNA_START=54 /DNA_END=1802 /DNA_ORIENTATION=-